MLYRKSNFFWQLLTVALLFISLPAAAQVENQTSVAIKRTAVNTGVNYTYQAEEYERQGKYTQAVDSYRRALLFQPKDAGIYNNLGTAYAKQRNFTEALAALKQAITLNPKLALAHYNISIVYDHLKRHQQALAAVRRALEIEPDNVKAIHQSCQLNLLLDLNKEAVGCYKSLKLLNSLDGKSHSYYGLALMRTKKFKRAIPVLKEAVRLSPDRLSAYNLLGIALYEKKRYQDAVEILKRALRINPDNAEIRHNLAIVQLLNGNKPAALVHYKILRSSNPKLARKLYKSIYGDKVIFVEGK